MGLRSNPGLMAKGLVTSDIQAPERAAGVHMLRRGFFPIFSQMSGPIWFSIVGKSSEGVREGQVCKIFLIGQEIRKFV